MDIINRKLDRLLEQKVSKDMKDVHRRILSLLNSWMNTESLSKALGYSQEYVSRKMAELKAMGKVHEKKVGKNIYYKSAD